MRTIVICGVLMPVVALSAHAGDLAPPPGPVSPTMKTLEEMEPRRFIEQSDIPLVITASGSYYLKENLIPAALGDPFIIEVRADNVTIDLRGFTIIGSTEVTTADDGILVNEGTNGLTVHNGTITLCQDAGVDAFTLNFDTRDCMYRDLRLVGNLGAGLEAGSNSTVDNCLAARNGAAGFFLSPGSVISRSVSAENGASGITSFLSGQLVIDRCTANNNAADGIALGGSCRVVACEASANGGAGIRITSGAVVEGCSVTANDAEGIVIGGGIVRGCMASGNSSHGISVGSESLIVGNSCSFNSSNAGDPAGIFVTGRDNRIDSNNCVENDYGIDVNGIENLIVRNSVSDSNVIDIDVAFGNDAGQLIGHPGLFFVATNPWANFIY